MNSSYSAACAPQYASADSRPVVTSAPFPLIHPASANLTSVPDLCVRSHRQSVRPSPAVCGSGHAGPIYWTPTYGRTMLTAELKKGTTPLLILALLEIEPRHGYDLSRLIEAQSR